jgi:hypothetical protein
MSPRRTAPPLKKQSGLPTWLVFAGIAAIIILAVVVGADFWSKSQPSPVASVSAITERGLTANGRTLGDPKARLVVIEFSDFQ